MSIKTHEPLEVESGFKAWWTVASCPFIRVISTVRGLSVSWATNAQERLMLLPMHKSEETRGYGSHRRSNSATPRSLFAARTTECRVHFYGLCYIRVMWKGYSRRGSHNSAFSDSYDLKVSLKWLLFFPLFFGVFFSCSGWVCFSLYLGFWELLGEFFISIQRLTL